MTLALLAALAAVQHAPPIPFVRSPRPDTIDVFWSPIPGVRHMGPSSGFRQAGVLSPPDRIALNPCGDLATAVAENSIDSVAIALADSLTRHQVSGDAWFRLGCLRSITAWPFADTLGQDDYLIAGVPERSTTAIAAWLRAVKLHPKDTAALISLAREALRFAPGRLADAPYAELNDVMRRLQPITPMESGGKLSLDVAAEALRRAARGGTAPAEVARACTSLMIDLGDLASAFDCSSRALVVGSDSTWHDLRLAWLASLRGDSAAVTTWFRHAAAAAHDRAARVELGWHFETDHDWRDTYAVVLGLPVPADAGSSSLSADVQANRIEKLRWLALSDSAFQAWVRANLATGRAAGPWQGLSRNGLARHFASISYSGAAFRYCVGGSDSLPPCAPYGSTRPAGLSTVSAHRYRLWDPDHGTPLALFVYRVEPAGLAATNFSERPLYEVQLSLAQFSPGSAARQDTTIVRRMPSGWTRAPILGTFVTPSTTPYQSWSLSVRQANSALRGGAYQKDQPATDSAEVTISDIVLGSKETAVDWNLGPAWHIVLIPGAAVDRANPLRIYYQLRASRRRPDVKLELAVYRTGSAGRLFAMASTTDLSAGITEIERDIDIGRLRPGSYRIEVRVTDHSTLIDSRATELQVQ